MVQLHTAATWKTVILCFVLVITTGASLAAFAQAPGNDSWYNAGAIPWVIYTPYSYSEDTTYATTDSYDPTTPCAGAGSHSVWFTHTPTVPGELSVVLYPNFTVSGVLSSWTGTPGGFTNVACNGNYFNGTWIYQHVSAGTQYSILVESYASNPGGTMTLQAYFDPDNDQWSNRFVLGKPYYSAPWEDTTSATTSSDDPLTDYLIYGYNNTSNLGCAEKQGDPANSQSVWFSYTPTTSGVLWASTRGSNYNTTVSAWTGSPGSFVEQACSASFFFHWGSSTNGIAALHALAGTNYSIMVQATGSSSGNPSNLIFYLEQTDLVPMSPTINFTAKQVVGTTSPAKTVTLKNQSSNKTIPVTLNLWNYTYGQTGLASNFVLTADHCSGTSLGPGQTCNFDVAFSPTNTGAIKGAELAGSTLGSDGNSYANNVATLINFSGTGVYPLAFTKGPVNPAGTYAGTAAANVITSVAFPTTAIGATSAQITVYLTNFTSAAIPLLQRAVSPDFAATDNCGTSLAAYASCAVIITFEPNRAVSTSGAFTLGANTSPEPVYLSLSGTGSGTVTTQVSVTGSLSWTNTYVGLPSPPLVTKTATIKNVGSTAITITSWQINGPFGRNGGTCPTTTSTVLQPGNSCTYGVTFLPAEIGAAKGALTIFDTDPTGKQIVDLVGTGVPAVTFTPAAPQFPSQRLLVHGAPVYITITNNMAVDITSFAVLGYGPFEGFYSQYGHGNACQGLHYEDQYGNWSITPGSTLPAHSSCTVLVDHAAVAQLGTFYGQVAVGGSQPGSPQILSLTTGVN